ncbi:sulfatase-like hydrolase/transferase, partial [Labilibaculum sp.]|uniref:sulfatase-like hydrolase/transferase n=1 Tax=Labilibaculum sp. TaxID=2060723 RepID=UPI003566C972
MQNQFKWFISATILLASVVGCSNGNKSVKKTAADRPNILYIMSDDHTGQAWGVYGGILKDHVHTPNIQRLAKEGCVLENALVSNSICTPSRATVLTGQYSHVNGVKTLNGSLYPEQNNIAKVLREDGYQTSIIGKWH